MQSQRIATLAPHESFRPRLSGWSVDDPSGGFLFDVLTTRGHDCAAPTRRGINPAGCGLTSPVRWAISLSRQRVMSRHARNRSKNSRRAKTRRERKLRRSGAPSSPPASTKSPRRDVPGDRAIKPARIEKTFFEKELPTAFGAEEESGIFPARLTSEQLRRRLWFRRMVLRLMAALAAFALIALLIRIANSG
jgi:hypothetical protein